MATYEFLTVWVLDAPIEKVWDAIVDYSHLRDWWQAIAQVEELEPGDATGVGSVWSMVWKTPLSYTLTFESRITQIKPPYELELSAIGEVEGKGRWKLRQTEAGTQVLYYWTVRTTKAWMNALALVLRPLMEWNHHAIMHQGGEGLAQYLGVRLLKAEAMNADGVAPQPEDGLD